MNREQLDQLTTRRLRRLASLPMDTTGLEAKLQAQLGMTSMRPTRQARRGWRWRALAVAASLVLALTVGLGLLARSGEPANAATLELSEIHAQLIAGGAAVQPARSVEEANAWIQSQSNGAPLLAVPPGASVRSCCLRHVRGRVVASVLLETQGQLVTLVVARGQGFAMPMGEQLEVDGKALFAHQMHGLQMVMAQREDHWLCVMGDTEVKILAQVAARVQF